MTQANQSEIFQSKFVTLPRVILTYFPPVPTPGDEVQISLEIDGEFTPDSKLIVDLLSETGERLISININSSQKVTSLTIPNDFSEGTYTLQVIYKNIVLDSTFIDVFKDQKYAQEMKSFAEGSAIKEKVKEAIKQKSYDQAINFQNEVEKYFLNANNQELAALSWEDLAEVLYKNNKLILSKDALEKALGIYWGIKGLENKAEVINRINKKIEICNNAIIQPEPPKNNIKYLREQKEYSQAQLAALVGVTPDIIKRWEEGQGFEELRQFFELAQALNRQIDDLIEINHDLYNNLEISSKIRSIREKKKLNQGQLAFLIGETPEIIQRWEEGQELEKLIQYFELSQVLDCKLSDLIELVDGDVKAAKLPEISPKVTDSQESSTRTEI